MAAVDDIIGAWVKRVENTRELEKGSQWGKPLDLDDGYEQTPEERRMPHKILKNAGHVPWEVEAMQRIAQLQALINEDDPATDRVALRQQLVELQQKLAVRLERQRR